MGAIAQSAPINEAVFLLSKISPIALDGLKQKYRSLSRELEEGIYAGPEDQGTEPSRTLLADKANIVIAALDEAARRADEAMSVVARKIRSARSRRLIGQVIVFFGSGSLLGAVGINNRTAAIATAIITLLASLLNIVADFAEKLLNPQSGNIYDAYQRLGEGAYKARSLASQIRLAVQYSDQEHTLNDLVGKANELCEQLNSWLIQLVTVHRSKVA